MKSIFLLLTPADCNPASKSTVWLLVAVWLYLPLIILAQAPNYPPKREFRGASIAAVENGDWPSSPGLTSEEQQLEFTNLLSALKTNGLNAVIVQIRPNADALYRSSFEPWSRWLTGKEGKAPDPDYDPLEFMITECRRQQMELHAWITPFRAFYNHQEVEVSQEHVFFQHPDWVVPYGSHSYFDPGLPEVRDYVLRVVMDVVNRYDIDGIYFDEFFYPYPINELRFLDNLSFSRYGEDFRSVDGWRRSNINQFIEAVHDSIEAVNSQVRFGVGSAGVWRNQSDDSEGSTTNAPLTSYDDLYSDVLTWLKNGWVDYVAPQLFMSIGPNQKDYPELLEWWAQNTYGRQLYIGQALYKVNPSANSPWSDSSQIVQQININRNNFQVDGSLFYQASTFLNNPLAVADRLRNGCYRYPAIVPMMSWNRIRLPVPPSSLVIARQEEDVLLQWNYNPHQDVQYFVVYGSEGESPPNISDPATILAKTYYPNFSFKESSGNGFFRKTYTFTVTAVSKNHDESIPSKPAQIKLFSPR